MQQLQEAITQIQDLPNVECNCDLIYPDPDYCPHKGMVRKSRIVDILKSKVDEIQKEYDATTEGMRDYGEPV